MDINVKQLHHEGEVEKEMWHYEVTIPESTSIMPITIDVRMNIDTIVCTLNGYTFKTYPWKIGNTSMMAAYAALHYLDWCTSQ